MPEQLSEHNALLHIIDILENCLICKGSDVSPNEPFIKKFIQSVFHVLVVLSSGYKICVYCKNLMNCIYRYKFQSTPNTDINNMKFKPYI